MSVNLGVSVLVYGGATGDQASRAVTNPSVQVTGEVLPVATYGRRVRGPRRNGNFSFHGAASSAGGAGSQLTVEYSLLPNPDETNAAHWVDSGIAPVVLTATTPFLQSVAAKHVEWIRYKIVIGTSQGSVWLYHLGEGRESQ